MSVQVGEQPAPVGRFGVQVGGLAGRWAGRAGGRGVQVGGWRAGGRLAGRWAVWRVCVLTCELPLLVEPRRPLPLSAVEEPHGDGVPASRTTR